MKKLFGIIKGQDNVVRILSSQLKSDRIGHAYLFLGEAGSGKEFLAREFAKYILCDDLNSEDCESCKRFAHEVHPDFIYINGEEGIKIEDVRTAIERINLSPALSKKKVLLFSQAEKMGIEAANALLKTIEEPPLDSVVLLTAISEKSLPETIASRVQRIKMAPLSNKVLIEILKESFKEEEIAKVIPLCEANIGEANRLIEDKDARKVKKKLFEDIETFVISKSIIEKFKVIEEYEKKKNLKKFFSLFSRLIFESLGNAVRGEKEDNILRKVPFEQRVSLGQKVLKIHSNLDYNVNLRLSLEEIALENLQDL